MSKLFFILGFAILAAASAGIVRRDAPPNYFEETLNVIKSQLTTFEGMIHKAAGATDAEDFKKKTEDYFGGMAKQWDEYVAKLEEKTKEFEDIDAVKDVKTSFNKAIENFTKEYPSVPEDLEKHKQHFQENYNEALNKLKALAESDESQNVKDYAEKLMKDYQEHFLQATKTLGDKFTATSN